MKKKISLVLVLTLLMTVLIPANIPVSAATVDSSNPAHLVMDFEDGLKGNTDSKTDYDAEIVADGAGSSNYALKVTPSGTGTGAPEFTFGYRPGYSYTRNCYYDSNGNATTSEKTETVTVERKYEFSAWIKVDADPAADSDTVELKYEIAHPAYSSGSYYDFTPKTIGKTFVTIEKAGLKAGEWVKVSGEFIADLDEKIDGTYTYKSTWLSGSKTTPVSYTLPQAMPVKVVVGGGMSYTIDDFVIMTTGSKTTYSNTPEDVLLAEGKVLESDRYYINQGQKVSSPIGAEQYRFGSTDGLSNTANTDGWKVADGTATLTAAPTGDDKITISAAGDLKGNYATITDNGTGNGRLVREDIDFRHGVQYVAYIWAKAEEGSEAALNARLQAVIDRTGCTDNTNMIADAHAVYANAILPADNKATVTLTTDWRRYEFTFYKISGPTTDEELADLVIRITDNGTGADISGAQYSLGNIAFYQSSGTTASALYAKGTVSVRPQNDSLYSVDVNSYVDGGNISECVTRVMVPFKDDYVILKTYTGWKNEETFHISKDVDITGMIMKVNPRDRSHHYGEEYCAVASVMNDYGLTAVAEFDQTVWAADMPSLTATIRYNAPSGNETLKALCGMYDANNKMVASDVQTFTLSQGEGEMPLSMNTVAEAVTAKVFLWEADTYAPRKEDVAELTKTTEGTFIYVDPASDGQNDGTYGYQNPLKNFSDAVDALKSLKEDNPVDNIYIILMPGYHKITSTINIDSSHTSDLYDVVVTSYDKNDKGVLSGGMNLTGEFETYGGGIWRASVEGGTQARQLYVNGVKGVRARSTGGPANAVNTGAGLTTTDTYLANYAKHEDLECVFYSLWTNSRCGVASITENNDGTITLNMDSLGWTNVTDKGGSSVTVPAWIENALELLDEPGEWYLDEGEEGENGYLYYMPREGEVMGEVEVILPTFDNHSDGAMINISGTAGALAKNIVFNGVEFSHTTWTRPSTEYGHSDVQNNHIREYTKADGSYSTSRKDVLCAGAVDVTYADGVDFLNCSFNRLGITALRVLDGAVNCNITGNEFYYISGSAMNIGEPYQGTITSSSSTKTDEQYVLDNINVTNNYIHHVAHDYWSAAAISVGHPKNTTVANNEICYIPYTGIHIGYGWESVKSSTMKNLKVLNNYIHDLFQGDIYDGAAIYTLGGTGGTADTPNIISGTYVENIGPGAATIYNDQASTYWHVTENVSDISEAWGEYSAETGVYKGPSNCMNINIYSDSIENHITWDNNYSSANDTYIRPEGLSDTTLSVEDPIVFDSATGTWSEEAQAIISNAGIEPEYRKNFKFGLQALLVAKNVKLSSGETFANTPCFVTGKNTHYKSKALVVDVISSNTAVATATADTITAVGAGTATITYTVLENGIYRKATTVVTVE